MSRPRRRPLAALFVLLTACFVGLAAWALTDRQWIVAVAAGVLGAWMGELAYRAFR